LTEHFRGYICNSCNLGFGKFNDDPETLKRAVAYLLTSTKPNESKSRLGKNQVPIESQV
jgi:hypothetical protein